MDPVGAERLEVERLGAVGLALDAEVSVPADEDRRQADEAVEQRDQLRHAGHLDDPRAVQADRGAGERRR